MIARLRGILEQKEPNEIILDVNGVGYGVQVPLTVAARLPEVGESVSLQIYTHVREDSLQLFGFLTELEKAVFEILLGVQGVGPKLAMGVLSAIAAPQFLQAVAQGDRAALTGISGVGKKTAERIFLDSKEKCEKLWQSQGGGKLSMVANSSASAGLQMGTRPDWQSDLEAALQGLGYREGDYRHFLADLVGLPDLETALKAALQRLGARGAGKAPLRGHA
jgi:Holliday junction DNA helicase RuvA